MSIILHIDYLNHKGIRRTRKLVHNKNLLIEKTKYFKSLFLNNFIDSKNEEVNIDLTLLPSYIKGKYINIIFDIGLNYDGEGDLDHGIKHLVINHDNTFLNDKINYKFNINQILLKNIPVNYLHEIICVNDFFEFNNIKLLISKSIEFYIRLINIITLNEIRYERESKCVCEYACKFNYGDSECEVECECQNGNSKTKKIFIIDALDENMK